MINVFYADDVFDSRLPIAYSNGGVWADGGTSDEEERSAGAGGDVFTRPGNRDHCGVAVLTAMPINGTMQRVSVRTQVMLQA